MNRQTTRKGRTGLARLLAEEKTAIQDLGLKAWTPYCTVLKAKRIHDGGVR